MATRCNCNVPNGPSPGRFGSTAQKRAGASNDAFNSSNLPDASSSACTSEVLLTSIDATHSGRFSFEATFVVATFQSMSSIFIIGANAIHQDGYSGSFDFALSNESNFDKIMAPLSDGTDTSVRIGLYDLTTVLGSSITVALNAPLVGLNITRARQNVTTLSLTPLSGGRTDFVLEVTWEIFGCPAGA